MKVTEIPSFFVGHLTGIIGNQQPVINPEEADKSTQFVHLCNQMCVDLL